MTGVVDLDPGTDEASRWASLWQQLQSRFAEEAGDPPSNDLEEWELLLLVRLCGDECQGSQKHLAALRRAVLRLAAGPSGATLTSCERLLRKSASEAWIRESAASALSSAKIFDAAGDLTSARGAYERALDLGVERSAETVVRLAQILSALGTPVKTREAQLRLSLRCVLDTQGKAVPLTQAWKDALARLALLLYQEGRDAEARVLLQRGGWSHRLASWVLHYPLETVFGQEDLSAPVRVFDNALPEAALSHLREVFASGSSFWQEHEYNESLGSAKVGYFSYALPLVEQAKSTLDLVIRHILTVTMPHIPELEHATHAEWWAHTRPHAFGHQLHYDSDNEGIGGARHPIASNVVFVEAPEGFGGPTIVTDQRLQDGTLATQGWLVHPRAGSLATFDGSVLHGVVPGRGNPPAGVAGRRLTWMVAFWRDLNVRPFGDDGLPGSSRPMPDPEESLVVGPRTYTWHQQLRLSAVFGEHEVAPPWSPVPFQGVWVNVDGEPAQGVLPDYAKCFQW